MRLARAASAFDKTECLDAYNGKLAFLGQLGLFDDTKRDSEAGERRIVSTAPGVKLPARRTVKLAEHVYILGTAYPDTFKGRVIRQGYVAHEATALAHVQTLGQACRSESGFDAWAARAWIKRSADHEHSSDLTGQFNLHFAQGEPVTAGHLVSYSGRHHLVRACHVGPAGTLIAFADEQVSPVVETVAFATGSFNRVTEELSAGTTQVQILRLRWQSLYELQSHMTEKFGPGDLALVVAASAITPRVGGGLTAVDGAWHIASAFLRGDVWLCRAVRHG